LKAANYALAHARWTPDEIDELRTLVPHLTIGEIARRLGRPYHAIALKISRLGLGMRTGNHRPAKIPRGAGLDKASTVRLFKALRDSHISVRRFCRANGLCIDLFVAACQKHAMAEWEAYTKTRTDLGAATCPYCDRVYYPLSKKQQTCSRRCQTLQRQDLQYFGGKRKNTVGLAEGVCQLCERQDVKGLSSHHVLGKQNDPDNDVLIALCAGCHQVVGRLATRKFVDTESGWENLISLVLARRLAERPGKDIGVHACVDLEWLTEEDLAVLEDTDAVV
jgi:hypothetical protein